MSTSKNVFSLFSATLLTILFIYHFQKLIIKDHRSFAKGAEQGNLDFQSPDDTLDDILYGRGVVQFHYSWHVARVHVAKFRLICVSRKIQNPSLTCLRSSIKNKYILRDCSIVRCLYTF